MLRTSISINSDVDGDLQQQSLHELNPDTTVVATDIESGEIIEPQPLFVLNKNKFILYIPPFLDAAVKGINMGNDLYTTNTSIYLTTSAGIVQFLEYTGLNVNSTADNCVAVVNMLRYNVYPAEWPELTPWRRILAGILSVPPTIVATIADASQTFFLITTIGTYPYLNVIPILGWNIIGGGLALMTGWTTLFTKGLEMGHAASSVLGKSPRHPNKAVHYSILIFSSICATGALLQETANTDIAMSSILNFPNSNYYILGISLTNGIAAGLYQKAFMTTALQQAYDSIAANLFCRKTALKVSLSLCLSLLTLLEIPTNETNYRSIGNGFDIPDDDSTHLAIKILSGYVFGFTFILGAVALYDPVVQLSNWFTNKCIWGYGLANNLFEYTSNLVWDAFTCVENERTDTPDRIALLAESVDSDEEEITASDQNTSSDHLPNRLVSTSIQGETTEEKTAARSPHAALNIFAQRKNDQQSHPQKNQNIMSCGLF